MSKIFGPYLFEVVFILFLALVPFFWYRPGYMGLGHDMAYPLAPTDFFEDRLFTWTNRTSTFGASQNDDLAGFFIHGLEALVVFVGLPLILSQKLVFIFWFVLPGLTMFIFLRSLYPEKEKFILRLSGSLFYALNHYLLQAWFMAEMTKFSIISAIPLVSLQIINVMHKKKPVVRSSVLLAVTLFFLNGGPGIPLWGGLILVSFILLLFLFIFSTEKFFLKLKRLSSFVLLSTVLLALLNSYWIYPYLKSYGQSYTQNIEAAGGLISVVNWSQMISKNTSFSNLFKLQGITEWYDNPGHPYSNVFLGSPFLIFLSILFPALSFIGMFKKIGETRDESIYKASFLAILLTGVVLSAGSHPPFGKLYDFALQNIPFFPMFRSPIYKFGMVLWFAYSYFIALGTYSLARFVVARFPVKVTIEKVGMILLIMFSALLFLYNFPFFTGVLFNWSDRYSTMVKVPNYIFDTKEELDKNNFSTRTLLLPKLDSLNNVASYNWGYYSIEPLFYILDRITTVVSQPRLNEFEKGFIDAIYTQLEWKGDSSLLKFIGAERAIFQNDFNFPQNLGYSYSDVKSKISNSGGFTLDRKVGEWDLYSLNGGSITPQIYAPSRLTYVSSSLQGLPLVTEIPSIQFTGDSFYFSPLSIYEDEPKIPRDFFVQYIIEGKCINCEKQAKVTFETTPLLIIPGDRLYPIIKFIQQWNKDRIAEPDKKNKFILEIMGRKIGSLGSLYYQDIEHSVNIINDLVSDLEEIMDNQLALSDKAKKEDDKARTYQSIKYYMSLVRYWKTVSLDKQVVSKLEELERAMIDLIEEPGLGLDSLSDYKDGFLYKYNLHVPQDGFYQISLYSPAKNRDEYEIAINGTTTKLKRPDRGSLWVQSSPLRFSRADLQVAISQVDALPFEIVTFPDKEFDLKQGEDKCQFFNATPIGLGEGVNYRIEFEQDIIAGQAPRLEIIEGNKSINLPDEQRGFEYKTEAGDNPANIKTVVLFKPAQFTRDVSFKFCFNSSEVPATTKVTNFRMVPTYPTPLVFATSLPQQDLGVKPNYEDNKRPSLEFVSLNQTKYLVRLKNIPENFILSFNSRFDNQWKIREIDPLGVESYFRGSKKEYLGGDVVEYQKLDRHIILDFESLIWEDRGASPNITLNGFASGWLLSDAVENKEKVYLLEYAHQNSLYKGALVSVISLFVVAVIYFKYGRRIDR